jgi:tripartite-type tricarboxylate transporter receptor subunit TctC
MMMKTRVSLSLLTGLGLALICSALRPNELFSQTPYFHNKTITILRGGEPGGSGDMQARALIPYLKKYIPGNPTIVIENMPGAAGMKAVNHAYSSAKPDGLTITAVGSGLASGAVLGLPGVRYDIDKLIYLGSTEHGDPYVFVSRKDAGFDSLEKLRAATGVRVGAQTVGHAVYISGRIFTYLLGLKEPKIVVGFGGVEMDLALARGEIDVRANSADTVVRRNAEALNKGQFNIHATLTIPKGKPHPRFANVLDVDTLTRNEKERQLVSLFREFMYPRWPYVLPPGTPPEIIKTLRDAMNKSFKDPGFAQEFKKLMGSEPSPLSGEEVESSIRALPRDPEIVGLYKKMAENAPLPPR